MLTAQRFAFAEKRKLVARAAGIDEAVGRLPAVSAAAIESTGVTPMPPASSTTGFDEGSSGKLLLGAAT